MRKKYLVTAATLAAAVMLAACGGKKENNENIAPTPRPVATEAPTQAPDENPEENPAENPEAGVDAEQMVQDIYQAVQEAYGSMYGPQSQVQGEAYFMQDTLKLDESWYDYAVVEVPMMSMNVDTFAIIHATEGNLENVAAALKGYQDYLINDSFQYPMNMPKIQASLTGTAGDYAYFVILSGLAEDVEEKEGVSEEELLAAQIEAYQTSNQVAVDIITGVVNGDIKVESWTELQKVYNMIKRAYGDRYLPSMQCQDDADYMKDVLKLDPSWCDDVIVEVPMISAHADMLVLVDVSEGNLENVQKALNDYKDYLVNESFQYPMNEARVKSAVIETVGDYVCFSILGGVAQDTSWATSEEELVEYYTSINMSAVYAIQNYTGIYE
ncbi:MAG: DUF4358 domain-containing protein [Lachnospiraceae bacterium]